MDDAAVLKAGISVQGTSLTVGWLVCVVLCLPLYPSFPSSTPSINAKHHQWTLGNGLGYGLF